MSRKRILAILPLSPLDKAVASAWMDMMDQATPEQRAHADKRFLEGLKDGRRWREEAKKK